MARVVVGWLWRPLLIRPRNGVATLSCLEGRLLCVWGGDEA